MFITVSQDHKTLAIRLAKAYQENYLHLNDEAISFQNFDPIKDHRVTIMGHSSRTTFGDLNLTPMGLFALLKKNQFPFESVKKIDLIGCELGLIKENHCYVYQFFSYLKYFNYTIELRAFMSDACIEDLESMMVCKDSEDDFYLLGFAMETWQNRVAFLKEIILANQVQDQDKINFLECYFRQKIVKRYIEKFSCRESLDVNQNFIIDDEILSLRLSMQTLGQEVFLRWRKMNNVIAYLNLISDNTSSVYLSELFYFRYLLERQKSVLIPEKLLDYLEGLNKPAIDINLSIANFKFAIKLNLRYEVTKKLEQGFHPFDVNNHDMSIFKFCIINQHDSILEEILLFSSNYFELAMNELTATLKYRIIGDCDKNYLTMLPLKLFNFMQKMAKNELTIDFISSYLKIIEKNKFFTLSRTNEEGNTLLHVAAKAGHEAFLFYFAKYLPYFFVKNFEKKRVIDYVILYQGHVLLNNILKLAWLPEVSRVSDYLKSKKYFNFFKCQSGRDENAGTCNDFMLRSKSF